jgi:hypothetical protein
MATATNDAENDLGQIVQDIQALKADLARLLAHVKTNATETVTDEASRIYGAIASEGQRYASELAEKVEEKPLASVLIAFAIGFIGGRILLR